MSSSTTDIMTTLKNLVQAINAQTQAMQDIAGQQTLSAISQPTNVKGVGGRLVNISVTTAGSAAGTAYDSAATGTGNPLWVIQNTVGVYEIGMEFTNGLYVVPGSGQVVAVGFS